jgi:type IV pilus assembly protein PilW
MRDEKGVTLIELMVAMVIGLVIMAAVYSTYNSQQQQYLVQEQVSGMQQNLRAALYFIARETRMAGYDSAASGNFGITDVTPGTITFTADFDDSGSIPGAGDTIFYSVSDMDGDGNPDLVRNDGADLLLAQGVEALGFAYAFDEDGDGELDTSGGDVIWAVDSNGNGDLDRNLDTNGDGVINAADDTNGDGVIEGVAIAPEVGLADIRAMKIWILARTDQVIRGWHDTGRYVVARSVVTPAGNDTRYKHRLLTTTVRCRNLNT